MELVRLTVCEMKNDSEISRRWFISATLAAGAAIGFGAKFAWNGLSYGPLSFRSEKVGSLNIRSAPASIVPTGGLAELVPVTEARKLLVSLIPCFPTTPKVGDLVHAFRLWGPSAIFPPELFPRPFPSTVYDGPTMKGLLLDSTRFSEFSPVDPPLIYWTADGVGSRTYSIVDGKHVGEFAHVDELLTECGEVGLHSETAVRAEDREGTLKDIVREAVAKFSINQEMEWTAEGLARYLSPQRSWKNRFGEVYSFDDVATVLLNHKSGTGACFDLHVPYALTCLLRIDSQFCILSNSVRESLKRYFRDFSQKLDENWKTWWSTLPSASSPGKGMARGLNMDELTVLSHNLEWIGLAPDELRPSRTTMRGMIESMFAGIAAYSAAAIYALYPPLSHAGRAICLLLEKSPNDLVGVLPDTSIR